MGFLEESSFAKVGSDTTSTNVTVDLVTPPAAGRSIVRAVTVFNTDNKTHTVTLRIVAGASYANAYNLVKVTMTAYDTLIFDTPLVIMAGQKLQIVMAEALASASAGMCVTSTYADMS